MPLLWVVIPSVVEESLIDSRLVAVRDVSTSLDMTGRRSQTVATDTSAAGDGGSYITFVQTIRNELRVRL
jgi:hypothetical protein